MNSVTKDFHRVIGIYATRSIAEQVADRLRHNGFAAERINILARDQQSKEIQGHSNEVLKDVVKDSAIGTAVGAGLGAAGEAALVAANLSLFVASPLIGPLTMIGWGAAVGAFAGAAAGIAHKEEDVSKLVDDAVNNGHIVLIAYAATKQEQTLAKRIIASSVKHGQDVTVEKMKLV